MGHYNLARALPDVVTKAGHWYGRKLQNAISFSMGPPCVAVFHKRAFWFLKILRGYYIKWRNIVFAEEEVISYHVSVPMLLLQQIDMCNDI
jgi:hypothetical protein